MSVRSLSIRVGVVAVVLAFALVGVFRLIERPVQGETDTFTALFSDANGLRSGDDVRVYGVQVGKVGSVELDGVLARVRFTVSRDHPVFAESTLAIRYQNLTGFRYLDIAQPENPRGRRDPEKVFGTSETVPAFDITTLFNGLQPVLAELTGDELNRFTNSLLAVLQGDGTGIGPALDAINGLARYASDRQAVISTLVGNLGRVADQLRGRSTDTVQMLTNLTNLFEVIAKELPGLTDFAVAIPPIIKPVRHMLEVAGITGEKGRDLDAALQQAFPEPRQAVEVFGRLPGLIQAMASAVPATGPQAGLTCSQGAAEAPAPLQILITGQRITLCRA
ncbi:MlaD family protein [Nocardia bovistercoris]|uniref:MCE family protein n=1 Tax=Nocardia bovistercoris TaxID=2785916 RepID=A0A931IA99_9NOCA|nr:MCE family protein [Nocardia bovistercoris]MBH0776773.1 MCE family protein [Nocardia bovistercoris]